MCGSGGGGAVEDVDASLTGSGGQEGGQAHETFIYFCSFVWFLFVFLFVRCRLFLELFLVAKVGAVNGRTPSKVPALV